MKLTDGYFWILNYPKMDLHDNIVLNWLYFSPLFNPFLFIFQKTLFIFSSFIFGSSSATIKSTQIGSYQHYSIILIMILNPSNYLSLTNYLVTLYLFYNPHFISKLNFIRPLPSDLHPLIFPLHIHRNWLPPIADFIPTLHETCFLVPSVYFSIPTILFSTDNSMILTA